MAFLGDYGNLESYEAQEGFDCLPPGWYPAEVIDSEVKTSQKGQPYIQWCFQVIGKPNRIWNNTSLGNETAMKIFKTMATCCGHPNPNFVRDTEEMHGRQCMIKVKIEHDESGKYDDKNVISSFKAMEGKPAIVPTRVPSATAAVPPKNTTPVSIPVDVPPAHVAAAAMEQIATPPPVATSKPKMPWEK